MQQWRVIYVGSSIILSVFQLVFFAVWWLITEMGKHEPVEERQRGSCHGKHMKPGLIGLWAINKRGVSFLWQPLSFGTFCRPGNHPLSGSCLHLFQSRSSSKLFRPCPLLMRGNGSVAVRLEGGIDGDQDADLRLAAWCGLVAVTTVFVCLPRTLPLWCCSPPSGWQRI